MVSDAEEDALPFDMIISSEAMFLFSALGFAKCADSFVHAAFLCSVALAQLLAVPKQGLLAHLSAGVVAA